MIVRLAHDWLDTLQRYASGQEERDARPVIDDNGI